MARDAGAGLVIIDCVAGSPDVDIAAAEVADLILISCRPRSVDLRAISHIRPHREAYRQTGLCRVEHRPAELATDH